MKVNQLLLAAILASAIGAPIETLAADKSAARQMTHTAARLPIESEMPSLGGATGWLNSPWADASGLPIILQGLLPSPHKVLIELVDANHQPLDKGMVTFVIPEKTASEKYH